MRATTTFLRGILALPLPIQLWLAALGALNMAAPLFFLEFPPARVTLITFFLSFGLMVVLTGAVGFTRLLGLGHILWLPLIAYLETHLGSNPADQAFGLWIRIVIAANVVSLAFDTLDVVRYLRGDRAPLVPPTVR